jgi:hypothetical protein
VPGKRIAQLFLIAESEAPHDGVDSVIGLLEGAAGRVDPMLSTARAGVHLRASELADSVNSAQAQDHVERLRPASQSGGPSFSCAS